MNSRILSFNGCQSLFVVANRELAFIKNPGNTLVGAGYVYPAANGGFDNNDIFVVADALETAVYSNNHGMLIDPYPLRQEFTIRPENGVIHSTQQYFLPDTHTYTGFRLGGTVNAGQTYGITVQGSGVAHNFTPHDRRMPIKATVQAGTGWGVNHLTAYLGYYLIYDRLRKTFPRDGITPYYEIIMATTGEYTTINTAINTYKTTPSTANYNAVLAAWNTAKTAFNTAFSTFVANPTFTNAGTLGTARPVFLIKTKDYNDVVHVGFTEYFDDINNTVTVTEHLPLQPATANNLLKGYFGAGTYLQGSMHCNGKAGKYPFDASYPYCKINDPSDEYAELHIQWEQRQRSSELYSTNTSTMYVTMYIRLTSGGTNYRIDNGTAVTTGTIVNLASFNTFLNTLETAFPDAFLF